MQCTKTVKTAESTSDDAYLLNAKIFRPMILAEQAAFPTGAGGCTAFDRIAAAFSR